jgi:hypothetical protein
MDEPMLRAYIEDPVPPEGTRTFIPGRWVGERTWPSPEITARRLYLGADRALHEQRAESAVLTVRSPQSHGKAAGEWMGAGCPGENPTDQRLDDGGALLFDTPRLESEFSVLGAPVVHLRVAADAPVAQLVVRLCDIAPDERVTRVSYQVLNLTHRDSHEHPTELVPGRYYDVAVTLNACGHRFLPGHRIRLAIGSAYWPIIWPAPYAATLSICAGDSALDLPVRKGSEQPIAFAPPVHGPRTPISIVSPGSVHRFTMQDHVSGEMTYVTEGAGGVFGEGILRFDEIGIEIAHSMKRELVIRDDDPLSARYVLTQSYEMGRAGWRTLVNIRAQMRADQANFYLSATLTARLNGEVAAERAWDVAIVRDLI